MKQILFALSFALFPTACMITPSHDGAVESPQTSVEASQLTSPTRLDAACDEACGAAFDACLGNATSDFDVCICDDRRIICERQCGRGGALHPCF